MKSGLVLAALVATVVLLILGTRGEGVMTSLCEMQLRPTEVRVSTTPVAYDTNLTASTVQLTEMAAQTTGRMVHGLTRTNMRSLVTVGSNGITNPVTGMHCLRPIVDVRLGFEPMTVYITSDQREGSCQFDVTMRHELQHVAVYRSFLETTAGEVEKYLKNHFGNRIYYFASSEEAQRRMSAETSERIGPFVEQSMQRVRELQAPLDTPDEYLRLERSCGSRP